MKGVEYEVSLLIYAAERDFAEKSEEEQGRIYSEYMAYSIELKKSGKMLSCEPFDPTSTATTIRVRNGETVEAHKLHPTRNLAREADRFEIDPMEQFRLLKDLRGTERDIVGCYHSHPNGRAEPSPRDLASAAEEHFVWLIAALDADGAAALTAHVYADGAFHPLALA